MDYRYSCLPNGLQIVTVPMEHRNSVGVAIWVRVGSRYEAKKISGVSHFLEHMLFKGTKKRTTRQIKEEIEGVGGLLNAFTGEEATCYYAKLPAARCMQALDVLADMVNDATLKPEEFKRERPVVLEEIKMYKDQPAHYVHEMMGELLWPKQALGRPIAGSLDSVSAMSRLDMQTYKKKYYVPGNCMVVVAGDVDHRDMILACTEHFTLTGRGNDPVFPEAVERQHKPQAAFFEKDTEQVHFVVAMHALSRYHPDWYALGVLNMILGGNMSSRLFEEVREQRGLAYDIRSSFSGYEDTGAFSISAGVETGKTEKTLQVILKELAKIIKKEVPRDELARAKEYLVSSLEMTLEDTMEHALWVGERALYGSHLPHPEEIKTLIRNVSAADVRRVAQDIFKTKKINFTLIGPVKEKVQQSLRRNLEI